MEDDKQQPESEPESEPESIEVGELPAPEDSDLPAGRILELADEPIRKPLR